MDGLCFNMFIPFFMLAFRNKQTRSLLFLSEGDKCSVGTNSWDNFLTVKRGIKEVIAKIFILFIDNLILLFEIQLLPHICVKFSHLKDVTPLKMVVNIWCDGRFMNIWFKEMRDTKSNLKDFYVRSCTCDFIFFVIKYWDVKKFVWKC